MALNKMSHMWARLQAYTLDTRGNERSVNHNNEWGGFSKRLNLTVFTGWRDHTQYDKESKTTTAMVLDTNWEDRPIGIRNQERWLKHAEDNNGGIACFFVIHAVDTDARPREASSIDDERVFVGKIERRGTQTFIVGQPKPLV